MSTDGLRELNYQEAKKVLIDNGWVERYIAIFYKDNEPFWIDMNAIVGVIYPIGSESEDSWLHFFYDGEDAIKWVNENHEKFSRKEIIS